MNGWIDRPVMEKQRQHELMQKSSHLCDEEGGNKEERVNGS